MLELETEGALDVKDDVPGAVTDLRHRADSPSSSAGCASARRESAGEIGERLELARKQLAQAEQFDHVVVNDELERAAEELAGDRPPRAGNAQVPCRP